MLAACGGPGAGAPTGPIARVLVDSAGGVHLNGRPTTAAALADSLRGLAAQHGGVIYSRSPAGRAPLPAQDTTVRRVLGAITALKLPIQLVRPESLATAGR